MSKERMALGKKGEEIIASALAKEGFRIREMNYETRYGEIDIIASKEDLLVFVEVKARKTQYFNLSQVISYPKQKKIIKTAFDYITKRPLRDCSYRFDVALLENSKGSYTITYIKNAFTAPEMGGIFLG